MQGRIHPQISANFETDTSLNNFVQNNQKEKKKKGFLDVKKAQRRKDAKKRAVYIDQPHSSKVSPDASLKSGQRRESGTVGSSSGNDAAGWISIASEGEDDKTLVSNGKFAGMKPVSTGRSSGNSTSNSRMQRGSSGFTSAHHLSIDKEMDGSSQMTPVYPRFCDEQNFIEPDFTTRTLACQEPCQDGSPGSGFPHPSLMLNISSQHGRSPTYSHCSSPSMKVSRSNDGGIISPTHSLGGFSNMPSSSRDFHVATTKLRSKAKQKNYAEAWCACIKSCHCPKATSKFFGSFKGLFEPEGVLRQPARVWTKLKATVFKTPVVQFS